MTSRQVLAGLVGHEGVKPRARLEVRVLRLYFIIAYLAIGACSLGSVIFIVAIVRHNLQEGALVHITEFLLLGAILWGQVLLLRKRGD